MRVIEPGHTYVLEHAPAGTGGQILTFVNREAEPHAGTLSQELLRANIDCMEVLIDRTNHCDSCLPWPGNFRIIKALSEAQRQMRLALLFHEQRAMERKMEKHGVMPESVPTAEDGHFAYPPTTAGTAEPQPKVDKALDDAIGAANEWLGNVEALDENEGLRELVDNLVEAATWARTTIAVLKRRVAPPPTSPNLAEIRARGERAKYDAMRAMGSNRIVPTECKLSDGTVIHQGDVLTVKGGVVCVNGVATRATEEVVTRCTMAFFGLRCTLWQGHKGDCAPEEENESFRPRSPT
jgi:hypothetical protein